MYYNYKHYFMLFQTLGIVMKAPNRSIDDVVSELRNAFAYVLKWPVKNIRVDKISVSFIFFLN